MSLPPKTQSGSASSSCLSASGESSSSDTKRLVRAGRAQQTLVMESDELPATKHPKVSLSVPDDSLSATFPASTTFPGSTTFPPSSPTTPRRRRSSAWSTWFSKAMDDVPYYTTEGEFEATSDEGTPTSPQSPTGLPPWSIQTYQFPFGTATSPTASSIKKTTAPDLRPVSADEMLYDLIFAVVVNRLGDLFITSVTMRSVLLFFILWKVFWNVWLDTTMFINWRLSVYAKYNLTDHNIMAVKAVLLLSMLSVLFLGGTAPINQVATQQYFNFVLGYIATGILFFSFFVSMYVYTSEARSNANVTMLKSLISIAIWVGIAIIYEYHQQNKAWWLWCIDLWVVNPFLTMLVFSPPKSTTTGVGVHSAHIMSRCGNVVVLLVGVSVLRGVSLVLSNGNWISQIGLVLTIFLQFSIVWLYTCSETLRLGMHSLMWHPLAGFGWSLLFVILIGGLVLTSNGIRFLLLVLIPGSTQVYSLSHRWLTSVGLFSIVLTTTIMAMMHELSCQSKSHRYYLPPNAWVRCTIRLVFGLVILGSPVMLTHVSVTDFKSGFVHIIILAVCVTCAVVLDTMVAQADLKKRHAVNFLAKAKSGMESLAQCADEETPLQVDFSPVNNPKRWDYNTMK